MQAQALTDVGRIRTSNQDYLFSSPTAVGSLANLFLVADGMGGHKAGDYASRFLVEHLVDYLRQSDHFRLVSLLRSGILQVNQALYRASLKNEDLAGMGTTLVAATIDNNTLYIANVGDSRLYLIRNQAIKQITKDHSYVEELVSLGQMERGSKDYQSKKNIITRAIGTNETVEIDFFELTLLPGDYLLLCSDGLSNMVEEEEIVAIVSSRKQLIEKAEALIDAANQNGGRDNIAVILIEPQISEVSIC